MGSRVLLVFLTRQPKAWSKPTARRKMRMEIGRSVLLLFGVDFAAVCSRGHVAAAFDPAFAVVQPGKLRRLGHEECFTLPRSRGRVSHSPCSPRADYHHVTFAGVDESLAFPLIGPVGLQEDIDSVHLVSV